MPSPARKTFRNTLLCLPTHRIGRTVRVVLSYSVEKKMKDLEWKDEYLLGIPAVDLQHKRIFDRFIAIAGGSTEQDRLLAEFSIVQLVGLLQEHFALEESMMRTLCYPELERHIEEHRRFHAEVQDLAQTAIRTKGSMSRETIKVTQKWLREHIMTSDRHYVEYFSGPPRNSVGKKRDEK